MASVAFSLKDSLQQMIVTDTPARDFKYRKEKPAIEGWKEIMNALSPLDKKRQIDVAIDWLSSNLYLSLDQMALGLLLTEKVALSRRVSSLSYKGYFHRDIKPNQNHAVTLKGIESYMLLNHPEIPIFYLSGPSDISKEDFLATLKENESAWIVMQHDSALHKTLLLFTLSAENQSVVQVFDSLGCVPHFGKGAYTPFEGNLKQLLLNLFSEEEFGRIEGTKKRRQTDSVNCASFITHDFETALILLKEGKSLFTQIQNSEGETEWQADPLFFQISQVEVESDLTEKLPIQRISPRFLTNPRGDSKKGCPKALLISTQLTKNFLPLSSYVPANHQEEGNSESDNDDDGCVIS